MRVLNSDVEKQIRTLLDEMIAARRSLGLSQRAIAKALNVRSSSVSSTETMRNMPRADTIIRMGAAVGLKLAWVSAFDDQTTAIRY